MQTDGLQPYSVGLASYSMEVSAFCVRAINLGNLILNLHMIRRVCLPGLKEPNRFRNVYNTFICANDEHFTNGDTQHNKTSVTGDHCGELHFSCTVMSKNHRVFLLVTNDRSVEHSSLTAMHLHGYTSSRYQISFFGRYRAAQTACRKAVHL